MIFLFFLPDLKHLYQETSSFCSASIILFHLPKVNLQASLLVWLLFLSIKNQLGRERIGYCNVGISSFPLVKIFVTSQTGMSWQMLKPRCLFNIIRVVTSYSCPCVEIVAHSIMVLPLGHPKRSICSQCLYQFWLEKIVLRFLSYHKDCFNLSAISGCTATFPSLLGKKKRDEKLFRDYRSSLQLQTAQIRREF